MISTSSMNSLRLRYNELIFLLLIVTTSKTIFAHSYPLPNESSSRSTCDIESPSYIISASRASTIDSVEIQVSCLHQKQPRKVCLMVEPTPFNYVCGYTNRFNEMLRYMSKAGDVIEIITTADSRIPTKDLPTERFGYNITHTWGFKFPLYNEMTLTLDLPQMKGASVLEKFKPDIIHATSP